MRLKQTLKTLQRTAPTTLSTIRNASVHAPQVSQTRAIEIIYFAYTGRFKQVEQLIQEEPPLVKCKGPLRLVGPFETTHTIIIPDATAYLAACAGGHEATAKLLVEHGANPHQTTEEGHQGTHIAALCGQPDIVKKLCAQHGLKLSELDDNGYDVYQAAENGLKPHGSKVKKELLNYRELHTQAKKFGLKDESSLISTVEYFIQHHGDPEALKAIEHFLRYSGYDCNGPLEKDYYAHLKGQSFRSSCQNVSDTEPFDKYEESDESRKQAFYDILVELMNNIDRQTNEKNKQQEQQLTPG